MTATREEMLSRLVDTRLYLVTEDAIPAERRLQSVTAALAGGAKVVQLRDKRTARRRLLQEARALRRLCHEWGAVFIVNDDIALAWCSDADGVHLGQDDLPVEDARRLLGPSKLVGLSISALQEAVEAERLGVDYIGVGAIYATPTKLDAELGGLELLRDVRAAVSKPLVAIGGIDESNAAEAFAAGADSVAVVRAVFAQPDVAAAARNLLEIAQTTKGR